MSQYEHLITAVIGFAGPLVEVTGGELSGDASWNPTWAGTVRIPRSSVAAVDMVDPLSSDQTSQRIEVNATRTDELSNVLFQQWSLYPRKVVEDYRADEWVIDLASQDAITQDWGPRTNNLALTTTTPATLSECLLEVLEITNDISSVGVESSDPTVKGESMIWTDGTHAWDYVQQLAASYGHVIYVAPDGSFFIGAADSGRVQPSPVYDLPADKGELQNYRIVRNRDSGWSSMTVVEFIDDVISDENITIPGTATIVPVRRIVHAESGPMNAGDRAYLARLKGQQRPASDLGAAIATEIQERHEYLGKTFEWSDHAHYDLRPRDLVTDSGPEAFEVYVENVRFDFGTGLMDVTARNAPTV